MTTTHTLAPGWTLTHKPETQCVALRGPKRGQYTCAGPDSPDHHGRLWYALGLALAASAGDAEAAAQNLSQQATKQLMANNLACVKAGIARLTEWRDRRRGSWCGDADDALITLQSVAIGFEMLAAPSAPTAGETAAPQVEAQEPSPTAGMNIAQRILHVGGRNPPGSTYVEFGSIQAVEALVRQVLRDLPAAPQVGAAPADMPNLACKSVQKRLATQWGYVPAAPEVAPTGIDVDAIMRSICETDDADPEDTANVVCVRLDDLRGILECAAAPEVAALQQQMNALLAHCPEAECEICASIMCPTACPMHFHHDGCPACAEREHADRAAQAACTGGAAS